MTPVSTAEAQAAVKELELYGHVETSALTQHNLKKCFDDAIVGVLKMRYSKKPKSKAKKTSGGFCSVL